MGGQRVAVLIGLMMALHGGCPEQGLPRRSAHAFSGAEAGAGVLTLVAPAAPGGGWDQTARVMQQVLAVVEPDTSVQVENVPGAAGTIGLARFVTAERGNPEALLVTGLVMVSGIVTNGAPVSLADTTPIARLTGEYEVIVVPAASRWRTLTDLVDAFKAAPATVAWGGGSAGGTDDLLVRLMANAVGVPPNQANYIAFPGGGAALAALLGGQVTAGVSGYGEFAGQIEAGTLRLLAVSSAARVQGIDAPTLREQGIAVDLANWRGLVAPPGLTELERAALTARVERMAASAEWKAVLERNGWADLLLTGPAFRQFLLSEQHRIEDVLRALASANASRATGRRLTPMTLPIVTLLLLAGVLFAKIGSGLIPNSAYRLFARKNTSPLLPAVASRDAERADSHDKTARTQILELGPTPFPLLAVLLVHGFAMQFIGFVPASAALFTVSARLLGSRRWLHDVVIGLAIAVVLYLAFTLGLGLSLPRDPVTRWLAGRPPSLRLIGESYGGQVARPRMHSSAGRLYR